MKQFLIALFSIINCICFTQNTNYYYFGKKELATHEVYDIIQDSNKYTYIATNKGIIKYDGYSFITLLQDSKIPTTSFFNLKKDRRGKVFCSNLYGQVLNVIGDSLLVYHDEPNKKKSLQTYFTFTNSNKMLVLGANLYLVDSLKSKLIYELPSSYVAFSMFFQTTDTTFCFYHGKDESYIKVEITKDSLVNLIQTPITNNEMLIGAINVMDTILYYDLPTSKLINKGDVFSFKEEKKQINNHQVVRYVVDDEKLCVLNNNFGLKFYSKKGKVLYKDRTFMENHFISSFYKDLEGNYLLGTFNEGIIVIPNIEIEKIDKEEFNISEIEVVNNDLYAATLTNEILNIDKGLNKVIIKKVTNRIVKLIGINNANLLLFDAKRDFIYNTQKKTLVESELASLKGAVLINDTVCMLATNKGLAYVKTNNFELPTYILNGRTYHVDYESTSKTLYASNVSGFYMGSIKRLNRFKYKNQNIIVNAIHVKNGIAYVAVKGEGVFLFKGKKTIKIWKNKSSWNLEDVFYIKSDNTYLYLTTKNGIIKVKLATGNFVGGISNSSGYIVEDIRDLALWNNNLLSVSSEGLQLINTDLIKEEQFTPTINITKVLVNDSVSNYSINKFNYIQTKFEFVLSSPTLKYQSELLYEYRLNDIDKEFQTNKYANNKVIYKNLSPGSYEFTVRAKWRDKYSNTKVFNFIISPPYWNTWWFYTLILFLFFTLVFAIAQRKIKQIKRKNEIINELNLSKLIAIQSQMNPHFIFNAINSIQDLILEEKTDESYNYVVKFAQLVRQTLNFSDKEFINFEDEISLLTVYLEIEKLRFKDDFDFVIEANNISDIMVPPMLIQPFVENAIKHGLLHKEGLKTVKLRFELDDNLICKISDNGIGRVASAKIKERRKRDYESFSTSATYKRLVIMNEHYEQDVYFSYNDLVEGDKVKGTEVTINIPFKES